MPCEPADEWRRRQDLLRVGSGTELHENYLSHIKRHEIIHRTNMFGKPAAKQSRCQTLDASPVYTMQPVVKPVVNPF